MSTTRQTIGTTEAKANTGAQYASCCSPDTEQVLWDVCQRNGKDSLRLQEIENPMIRSLHFPLSKDNSVEQYKHFAIPGGTNQLVKQFLYAGKPDVVSFETRLMKLWKHNVGTAGTKIVPEFDLRPRNKNNKGKNGNSQASPLEQLDKEYDVVILALPPKDAVKFFQNDNSPNSKGKKDKNQGHDPQSQADLHRRYNQNKNNPQNAVPSSSLPVALHASNRTKLRQVEYVGRYSLALWFKANNGESTGQNPSPHFAETVFSTFQKQGKVLQSNGDDSVLDAVFLTQEGPIFILVAQSTVALWRKYSGVSAGGGRGGGKQKRGQSAGSSLHDITGRGRKAVRDILTRALEDLASIESTTRRRIPKVEHAKLLNWRTSQVAVPLHVNGKDDSNVLSTENGQVILTGDWCTESSFEGCYQAAVAASNQAVQCL